ncbi:hypothetical protein H4F17_17335 [Vibrio cholerae]
MNGEQTFELVIEKLKQEHYPHRVETSLDGFEISHAPSGRTTIDHEGQITVVTSCHTELRFSSYAEWLYWFDI